MLASYQFVPSKFSEQLPQKMGGGFRFRYKSAYTQNRKPERVNQQKVKQQLTQNEINEAMNQLLDGPASNRKNQITKTVAVDFDADFQKMASAEETVKNALRLLSSIQQLKKTEVEQEAMPLGILSGTNSNSELLQVAKYRTDEANNFISNATLQQTPEQSATPGHISRAVFDRKHAKRPQSSVNPNGVKARPIELDRMVMVQQGNDRQACGTLTPHSDLNRQDKSAKILNQLLEVHSSQKSRKRLIKSNSNTTRNADIENILNINEPKFGSNVEITQEKVQSAPPLIQDVPQFFTTDDTRTPLSLKEESQHKEVEQNAMACQTPHYNQFPIPILSDRQIGYPALVSNKTNFSQLAWNISLMRQDSYDPTSSKDLLTFHLSDRMLKTPVAAIPQLRSGQPVLQTTESPNQDSDEQSTDKRPRQKNRPVTSRPALVNINSHNNIEKAFMQQITEREIIRTQSTAQINKLSVGALMYQAKSSASKLTKFPVSKSINRNSSYSQAGAVELKARKAPISSSLSPINMELHQNQRDQPVKVKFMLHQIDEKGLEVQAKALQQQPSGSMNVTGFKLSTIDTIKDRYNNPKQPNSSLTPLSSNRHVIYAQNKVDTEIETGRDYQPVNELIQPSIRSRISYQSKVSPRQSKFKKSKYEITKHFDHNLREVETLKKIHGSSDNAVQMQKSNRNSHALNTDRTENQIYAEHRVSTILDIDTNIQQIEKEKQKHKLHETIFLAGLNSDLPMEQIQISAFGSTITKINCTPSQLQTDKKLKQKLSPVQRKSFIENITSLARIISSQQGAEQVAFQQKYTNLINKHSKKSWLPNPNARSSDSVTQKQLEKVKSNQLQQKKTTNNHKESIPSTIKSHALAFLNLKSPTQGKEHFQVIRTVRVSRPQTTKSANRVAILQQREAPLPPPSAKDQRRIGCDINFLRSSGATTQKVGCGKSMIDIGKSNYQLILEKIPSVIVGSEPVNVKEGEIFWSQNSQKGAGYSGMSRQITPQSNLFARTKQNQTQQQLKPLEA